MSSPSPNPLDKSGKNPWIQLLALTAITIGGVFFFGQLLALGVGLLMSGKDLTGLISILVDPTAYPEQRLMFLLMQGMTSAGGFIIAPVLFYFTTVKGNFLHDFFSSKTGLLPTLTMTFAIVFSFMVINTVFIEWNANIQLPEALSGFERWAKDLEESMAAITEYLTTFDSPGYFIMAVIVVAMIPAIGEELLFRGLLQNILRRIAKNDHAAVWLAAFLFGAIHFQFYGMVPRILLGALFGYLYLWTGNLLIPVFAHFINNGVSLAALYIHQQGMTEIDVESTDALPLGYVLFFSVLFITTLFYFKKYLNEEGRRNERLVDRI